MRMGGLSTSTKPSHLSADMLLAYSNTRSIDSQAVPSKENLRDVACRESCHVSSIFHHFTRKAHPESSRILGLCRSFNETLLFRLQTLTPRKKITLVWLSSLVDVLSMTYANVETLIRDLKISGVESPIASHLDISVNILDICSSIKADIDSLIRHRLLIRFLLHLLEDSRNLQRATELATELRNTTSTANLSSAVAKIRDLNSHVKIPPSGKASCVEIALSQIFYAVEVLTGFVAGCIVAMLSTSSELDVFPVSGDFILSETFNDLHSKLSGELKREIFARNRCFPEEYEEVSKGIDTVLDLIKKGAETELPNAVKNLVKAAEVFSDGLDRLLDSVNCNFRVTLRSRNALLDLDRDRLRFKK